ncbi:MAG: ABC transporter ATP-binding protein [SAR324 cluster bacterium]|nr:ABC transporter ATP-binding protein [SAR324 cluster bacterium]
MARIDLQQISKVFPGEVSAIQEMTLTVEDGEFVALLGPSGCGKSTTLLMLAGIYSPTHGEIRFNGQVINDVEAKDRNVGIVFQSYALYPHMTVRQNIQFPLKFKKVGTDETRDRSDEVARLVQISNLLERRPSQLSGGEQQRVALARALVKEPQLLLLDEPLSNLDATLRLSMRSELKALQRRLGITTILVTHDQIEAMTMADRIICMNQGRIQQIGTPDDLYQRPATLFVAGFIGAPPINLLPGHLSNATFTKDGFSLACQGGEHKGEVTLGVRPEHLRFDETGLPGRVEQVEPMGRENLYHVKSAIGDIWLLSPGTSVAHHIQEQVYLNFDAENTIFFDSEEGVLLPGLSAEAPHSN